MTLIGQALTSSGQKVNHELVLWVLFFLVPGVSLSSQDFGMTRAYSYWQCHQIPWKGLLHSDQIEVRCWGVAQRSNRVWLACPKWCLQTLRIFELNTIMASNGPGFLRPFQMNDYGKIWTSMAQELPWAMWPPRWPHNDKQCLGFPLAQGIPDIHADAKASLHSNYWSHGWVISAVRFSS